MNWIFGTMGLLIDTHVLIWWVSQASRLSRTAYDILDGEADEIVVSVASIWEMGIKVKTGKLSVPSELAVDVPDTLKRLNFQTLSINLDHAIIAVASS